MTEHLVVMAAGQGMRMGPLTRRRPKPLLPVAGVSLLRHVLDRGAEAGFRRFTVIVHSFEDQIRNEFPEVDFVSQGPPKGTGHAVGCLEVDEDFVLASGDTLVGVCDLKSLRKGPPSVLAAKVEESGPYGLLEIVDGAVVGVHEKVGGVGWANTGTYRLTPEHVRRCRALAPSPRGEYELTDALSGLTVVEAKEWLDAGRPWDLLKLHCSLMPNLMTRIDGQVGENVEIHGPVVIKKGAKVHGHSVLEGPVWIGPNARVGPNAYLRPNTSIGADCHIGNSCEIKGSIIMEGTNIPHLSYVGDSVIGANCNLGAGTQVANLKTNGRNVGVHWENSEWIDTGRRKLGCILGDGVKTGVNASLMPGLVVGAGEELAAGQVHRGWISS